jgi:predicted transcriptional regulator
LDYYGFDLSNQKALLIEKMLKGSYNLDSADLELIEKMIESEVAQIPRKLSELRVYFSRIPEELSDMNNSRILQSLQKLQDMGRILNE